MKPSRGNKMKSTKFQAPSSREAPNRKLQALPPLVESLTWWDELSVGEMVLKDERTEETEVRHPFDLLERTARFGEAVVRFSKTIPRDPTNNRLIDQLVGCGTSIGANYCEANESVSKKDFRYPIGRCKKEAK